MSMVEISTLCYLQCIDTIGWVAGRASGRKTRVPLIPCT